MEKTTREIAADYGKTSAHSLIVKRVKTLIDMGIKGAEPGQFRAAYNNMLFPMFYVSDHMLDCVIATMEASRKYQTHVSSCIIVPKPASKVKSDRQIPTSTNGMSLYEKEGVIMADSRDVADRFGMQHKNVIARIRKYAESQYVPSCYFSAATYGGLIGTPLPYYEMNRDGFTLLVMGFQGDRALEFKTDYINAFNAMEAKLMKMNNSCMCNGNGGSLSWDEHAELVASNEARIIKIENINTIDRSGMSMQLNAQTEKLQEKEEALTALRKQLDILRKSKPKEIEIKQHEVTTKTSMDENDFYDLIDDGFSTPISREAVVIGASLTEILDILIKEEQCVVNHGTNANPLYRVRHGADAVKKGYVRDVNVMKVDGTRACHAQITARGHKWIRNLFNNRDKFVENDIR